jgi:hypothetical protein
VPEVGRPHARREHEQVVVQRAVGEHHAPRREVDGRDRAEQHGQVGLPREHLADRRADVGRGQPRGRHLVEQGLEEVVVVPVDQRDRCRRALEPAREVQAREATAHEHDAREGRGVRHAASPVAGHDTAADPRRVRAGRSSPARSSSPASTRPRTACNAAIGAASWPAGGRGSVLGSADDQRTQRPAAA